MNKKKLFILISVIIAVAILVCVGIFALSGNKANKIADKLDLGEKYLEELEYEKALATYKEILEIDPKNVEAYVGIVDTYMAMGDYAMALEYAEKGYEETGDQVFVGKIEESKAASGTEGQGTQNSIGGEAGNQEEPPVATPEPDILMEGTEELEITLPDDVEIISGNGGVVITKKGELYGAVNYAGEEIVPNIYDGYYQRPNEEGYFVLAEEITVEEDGWILTAYNAYVFDAWGQMKLEITEMRDLYLFKDKIWYKASEPNNDEIYTVYTVQLYDLAKETTLYSASGYYYISMSDDGVFYYGIDGMRICNVVQVNEMGNVTVKEMSGSNHKCATFVGGFAIHNEPDSTYDTYLCSEDGKEWIYLGESWLDHDAVRYYDNGMSKQNKGKVFVRHSGSRAEEEKYYLFNMKNADSESRDWAKSIVATYDYIGMSDSPYYLAADGDKYFYIDENGQVVHDSYLDYSKFYGGYAMIIDTDGCAYMIDEQFHKVAGGYEADSVFDVGGIFCVEKDGKLRYITRPTE